MSSEIDELRTLVGKTIKSVHDKDNKPYFSHCFYLNFTDGTSVEIGAGANESILIDTYDCEMPERAVLWKGKPLRDYSHEELVSELLTIVKESNNVQS